MMRFAVLAAASALAALPATSDFARDEYAQRRAALRKALPDCAIALQGAAEAEKGGLRSGFLQDPNFLYLTGWREPGAMLLLTPGQETFFLPARSDVRERYTGRKAAPGDANIADVTGFETVLDTGAFATRLKDWPGKVCALPAPGDKLKEALAGRETADLAKPLARLRMIKSAAEIARIQRSVDATADAHLAAWKRAASGLYEYQVAATMTQTYFEQGCERHAYMPIVASGPNAIVLHYAANKRRMDSGELLLMDVGAECADYAADITRTIPVNGKFTARQREIYDIVLGAQNAALAAARPGVKFMGSAEDSLNGIARKYVDTHGKDRDGNTLGKYYLHGLGHHVGLEVHDATDPDLTLQPGMVITLEPGVYIASENIGVRIEDVVLITETGARLLSSRLPREAGEIEKRVRRR